MTDLAPMESAFNLRAAARQAAEAGIVTAEEGTAWLAALAAADAAGLFFSAVSGFLVRGRKPA